MPQTASEVGLNDPYDPIEALPASARLLKKLHREFGNLGLAAAAYNAGSGRIRDWLSRRQPLPRETKGYVCIITGYSAEDWTEEQSVSDLPTALPIGTPCREINTADGGIAVPVRLALTGEMQMRAQTSGARGGHRHDGPLADVGATVLAHLVGRSAEALPGSAFVG